MEKKYLIPTVIGVLLLCGIVFTLVYKKTSNEPNKPVEIETIAPTETEPIESKVSTKTETSELEDFNVNETKAPAPKSLEDLMDGDNVVEYNSESSNENNIEESTQIDIDNLSESDISKMQSDAMEEYSAITNSTEVVGIEQELMDEMQDKYESECYELLADPEIQRKLEELWIQ